MNLAEIKDGKVINIVRVDPNNIPEFAVAWPDAGLATIGDTWDGVQFDSTARVADQVRKTRNMKLATEVDPIAGNTLRWAALTTEQQQALADYRQALLDIPQQAGFPHEVVWPTKPTEGN